MPVYLSVSTDRSSRSHLISQKRQPQGLSLPQNLEEYLLISICHLLQLSIMRMIELMHELIPDFMVLPDLLEMSREKVWLLFQNFSYRPSVSVWVSDPMEDDIELDDSISWMTRSDFFDLSLEEWLRMSRDRPSREEESPDRREERHKELRITNYE